MPISSALIALTIPKCTQEFNCESLPTRGEHERRVCFQREMSMKGALDGVWGSSEGDLAARFGHSLELGCCAPVPRQHPARGCPGAGPQAGLRAYRTGAAALRVLETGQAGQGPAALLSGAQHGAVAVAADAPDPALPSRGPTGGPAPRRGQAVPAQVHAGGHRVAGRDRRVARDAVRTRHAGTVGARLGSLRGRALRAPGGSVERAPVQPAAVPHVRAEAGCAAQHTPGAGLDRGAQAAAAGGPAGLPADRFGASGGLG